jgi:hypothetical protein
MVIVFSVILFLLGLLGAEALITLKLPAFRKALDKLIQYQEALGMLGIVFGGIYFVSMLDMIGTLGVAPMHFFLTLASVTAMIGLGLIFGLEVIRRNLKDTSSFLFQKLEAFRLLSLRFQKPFGVAGVVLGLLTFFAHI